MSYLLDKKNQRNKLKKLALVAIFFIFIFIFRVGVYRGLSIAVHFIFRPVLVLGNNIEKNVLNIGSYFSSKKLIYLENETLKLQIAQNEAKISNYNSILNENLTLKETLGRKIENKNFIISSILSKPNISLYDILVIDIGTKDGIILDQKVFAYGFVPIGKIAEVYANSSKVILYSTPGEITDVVVPLSNSVTGETRKNVSMKIIGRGGGNFEMLLPRDFMIEKGNEVFLPGIIPHTVGVVETILSDPRDSYQKALLRSPVNLFQLSFVEIEK